MLLKKQTSHLRLLCLYALFLIVTLQQTAANEQERLWEGAPSLYELAKTVTIENELHPTYPQPDGIWGGTSPKMTTPQMKMSIWGPANQVTLSMNKTDVWDRRKGWEKPVTLEEIRRGAFSPKNADDVPSPGWDNKHIKIFKPEGGFYHPYSSWEAYPFPCPKPVGQAIIFADDFMEMTSLPKGKTQCQNGLTTVELKNKEAEGIVEYLAMMDEATMAIRADFKGLKKAVSFRLMTGALYKCSDRCSMQVLTCAIAAGAAHGT